MSIFEKATRMKLRFPYKGQCRTEDLWDLSEQELDGIYKTLQSMNTSRNTESLLKTKDENDEILELQIAVVKRVFEVKDCERVLKEDKVKRDQRKQKLLSIIAEKQDSELRDKSIEELKEMTKDL